MMKLSVSFAVLLFLALIAEVAEAGQDEPVSLDIAALNRNITNAVDDGAPWTSNALLVTQELFGRSQRHFVSLPEDELVCSGHASLVTVVVMRGSFSRAWGWGDWCEVHYRKVDDGTLRLCYILPMNKEGARVRSQKTPLKARKAVQLVE